MPPEAGYDRLLEICAHAALITPFHQLSDAHYATFGFALHHLELKIDEDLQMWVWEWIFCGILNV